MSENREKFATQMDKEILARLRKHAKSEGRQIQSIVEEAVEAFIDERDVNRPNPRVMAAAERMTKKYAKTLAMLAK